MESNDELKKQYQKSYLLLFRWYNRVVDIDFYKILSDKKSYGNILTYDIS